MSVFVERYKKCQGEADRERQTDEETRQERDSQRRKETIIIRKKAADSDE